MRGQLTVISRKRVAMASSALISRLAATASPDGEAFPGGFHIRPGRLAAAAHNHGWATPAPYKESRCLVQTAGIFYLLSLIQLFPLQIGRAHV